MSENKVFFDGFHVYGFEQLFEVMKYPAGESHVEANFIPPDGENVIIASHVRTFEDLANCVTAHRILEYNNVASVEWFIPYFPFGRHDRRRSRYDGLEIQLALEMVKPLRVTTLDPHSDVLGQLKHFTQRTVVNAWIRNGLLDVADPLFIIPDLGATKKAMTWMPEKKDKVAFLQATKTRDVETGQLSGTFIYNEHLVYGKDCIIVDDICDGGGTFLLLADKLRQAGAKTLTLAVSHGLFTKGTGVIQYVFDRVFITGLHRQGMTRVGYNHFIEELAHERC